MTATTGGSCFLPHPVCTVRAEANDQAALDHHGPAVFAPIGVLSLEGAVEVRQCVDHGIVREQ